jgi:hypothetical protein
VQQLQEGSEFDIAPSAILACSFTFSSLSILIFDKEIMTLYCDTNWSPPTLVYDACAASLGVLMSVCDACVGGEVLPQGITKLVKPPIFCGKR